MASDQPVAVGVSRFRAVQSPTWLNNGSVRWLFAELNIVGGLPRFAANSKRRDRNNAATGTGEFSLVKGTSERPRCPLARMTFVRIACRITHRDQTPKQQAGLISSAARGRVC